MSENINVEAAERKFREGNYSTGDVEVIIKHSNNIELKEQIVQIEGLDTKWVYAEDMVLFFDHVKSMEMKIVEKMLRIQGPGMTTKIIKYLADNAIDEAARQLAQRCLLEERQRYCAKHA